MKLVIILLLSCLISSCHAQTSQKQNPSIKKGQTSIAVNDNVQLFRIAYNLAIADSIDVEYRPCNNSLYRQTTNRFSKYSDLPLVQKIRMGDEWNADLPAVALCFDENLNLLPGIDAQDVVNQFGWYGENLDSLSILLKDFKDKSNYQGFEKLNYESFLDSLNGNQVTNQLNTFFKQSREPNLKIIFDPQNNITNKAITFLNDEETTRHFLLGYFCDHPDSTSQVLQVEWDDDYRRIIIHENSHLYTDALFKKYYDAELDSLINQPKFEEEYTDVDEIMVRGITAKILEVNYGKEVGEYEISIQPSKSKLVYDALDEYVENESMDFEFIYREIVEALKKSFL